MSVRSRFWDNARAHMGVASHRDVCDRAFEIMMRDAQRDLERELVARFLAQPVQLLDYDGHYLLHSSAPDLYVVRFQLRERMQSLQWEWWSHGMGTRLIPGKVLRNETHSVTARRVLIRALQTYRLPSERKHGFWPFCSPQGHRR